MHSTWESRDLPVLREIVRLYDEKPDPIYIDQLSEATGLSDADVARALIALTDEQPPFFRPLDASSMTGRSIIAASEPTGYARRTVGAWPTPEGLAERIVVALDRAADAEPDEEKRGRLRTLAAGLGGFGREVLVEVASGAIVKSSGIG